MLHELATGSHPFGGGAPARLIQRILSEPPPPLRSLRPGLSAGLEQVVTRLLAKSPAERFRCAADVLAALVT